MGDTVRIFWLSTVARTPEIRQYYAARIQVGDEPSKLLFWDNAREEFFARYNALTVTKEPLPAPSEAEMEQMTTEVWARMTEAQQRAYVAEKGIRLSWSSGLAEEYTCGWGELSPSGYWEYPCWWAVKPAPQEGE